MNGGWKRTGSPEESGQVLNTILQFIPSSLPSSLLTNRHCARPVHRHYPLLASHLSFCHRPANGTTPLTTSLTAAWGKRFKILQSPSSFRHLQRCHRSAQRFTPWDTGMPRHRSIRNTCGICWILALGARKAVAEHHGDRLGCHFCDSCRLMHAALANLPCCITSIPLDKCTVTVHSFYCQWTFGWLPGFCSHKQLCSEHSHMSSGLEEQQLLWDIKLEWTFCIRRNDHLTLYQILSHGIQSCPNFHPKKYVRVEDALTDSPQTQDKEYLGERIRHCRFNKHRKTIHFEVIYPFTDPRPLLTTLGKIL